MEYIHFTILIVLLVISVNLTNYLAKKLALIIFDANRRRKAPNKRDRIYISGRISGTEILLTRRRFMQKEIELNKISHVEYNPMKELNLEEPLHTWLYYMRVGICNLMICDSIYMLKGWRKSRGARIEFTIARLLKYKIYFE